VLSYGLLRDDSPLVIRRDGEASRSAAGAWVSVKEFNYSFPRGENPAIAPDNGPDEQVDPSHPRS